MFHLMFLPTAAQKGTDVSSASTGKREYDADGSAPLFFRRCSQFGPRRCPSAFLGKPAAPASNLAAAVDETTACSVLRRRANSELLQCFAPPFPTSSRRLLCHSRGKQRTSNSHAVALQLVITLLAAATLLRHAPLFVPFHIHCSNLYNCTHHNYYYVAYIIVCIF